MDIQDIFQPRGIQIPENIPSYAPNSQYNVNPFMGGGRMPFGLGSIMMSMFGQKMWPIMNPGGQQTMYDTVWQRNHDIQMMGLARKTVSSWYPFQNLGGMNENSGLTQVASMLMSDPDGIAANIMKPVLGGNPIQAQMESFATLQGVGAAALGNGRGTSPGQLSDAMEAFNSVYYKQGKKALNGAISTKYGDQIRNGLGDADTQKFLGLNPSDINDLIDPHKANEKEAPDSKIRHSLAYDRVMGAQDAIDTIHQNLNNAASTPEEAMKGIDKGRLGDELYNNVQNLVSSSFKSTEPSRHEAFKTELESGLGVKDSEGKSELSIDDSTIKKLKDAIVSSEGKNKLGDELQKIMDNFHLQEKDKNIITDAVTKGVRGGAQAIGDAVNKGDKNITQVASGLSSMSGIMTLQNIVKGMDYKNNLGLSLNTLVTGRNEMIKDRLASPTPTVKGLDEISKLFAGSDGARIPSLISAAKGVFGNDMPDKELFKNLSDYIGNSPIDLNNEKDSTQVETSLRNMKAIARENNIDINTMMSFQKQAQAFAASSPNTSMMGGLQVADIISSAGESVAALATDNSPKNDWFIRQQGGTAGEMRNIIQGKLENAQQPMAGAVAALQTYIETTDTIPENQRESKLAAFKNFAAGNDKNFNLSQAGIYGFMQNTLPDAGAALQYAYNNPMATSRALTENSDLANVGNRMTAEQIKYSIKAVYGDRPGVNGLTPLQQFNKYIDSNDYQGLMSDPILKQDKSLSSIIDKAVNNHVFDEQTLKNNEPLRKQAAANKHVVDVSRILDEKIDKTMGAMRPDMMTKLVQHIASGALSSEGISSILKPFGITTEGQELTDITANASQLSRIEVADSAQNIAAAAGETSTTKLGHIKAMNDYADKYGITTSSLKEIAEAKGDDAIAKLLPKGELPKGEAKHTELANIQQAAIDFRKDFTSLDAKGNQKFDYDSELGLEGNRAFYSKQVKNRMVDNIVSGLHLDDSFNELAGKELNDSAADISDPLKKTIMSLSETTDKNGKVIEDYNQGFGVLSDMQNEKITGTTENGKDSFALPDSYTKFIAAYTKNNDLPADIKADLSSSNTYGTSDAAAKVKKELDTMINSDVGIKDLTSTLTSKNNYTKELEATTNATEELPIMVNKILDKMGGLNTISDAIRKLTAAVKT